LADQLVIITSPGGQRELGIPVGVPVPAEQGGEISGPLSAAGTPLAIAAGQDGVIRAVRVPHTMKEITDLASIVA
jgi:hypothetical protein